MRISDWSADVCSSDLCFLGVFVGTLIGVLPGIGPVAAMSLLMPLTFYITPEAAIIMLAGIYYGSMYGGSTTAILVNIPGEAASVVTTLDGHQMARQGRAGVPPGGAATGPSLARPGQDGGRGGEGGGR